MHISLIKLKEFIVHSYSILFYTQRKSALREELQHKATFRTHVIAIDSLDTGNNMGVGIEKPVYLAKVIKLSNSSDKSNTRVFVEICALLGHYAS